jgi:hypothetical protein
VAQSYEAGFVAHLIKPVARPGKLSAEHQRETLPFLKSAAKCPLFFRLEVTCAILAQSQPQIRVVSGLDKSSHHRWKALLSRFLLDRQKPSRRISLPVAKVPYPTQVIQSNQKKQLA